MRPPSGREALVLAVLVGLAPAHAAGAEAREQAVEATTATGEKVLLYPNGRWEYLDPQKAAEARKVAERFPENQGCPPGAQGGLLGLGRCIMPGDKDYNRGSLNPNRR